MSLGLEKKLLVHIPFSKKCDCDCDLVRLAFSPDKKVLAHASHNHIVHLCDVETGESFKVLKGHTGRLVRLAFSSDGKKIASCSVDKTVRLWDAKTGELMHILEGHSDWVLCIVFSQDSKTIVSSSLDKTVRLWNVDTGKLIKVLHANRCVGDIALSPCGKTLATCLSSAAQIWNTETGEPVRTIGNNLSHLYCVAFSPDGKTIASGSDHGIVKTWNFETGELLQTFEGHTCLVYWVQFSPDGRQIVSASCNYTVRFWSAKTGKLIYTFSGSTNFVSAVAFTKDRKKFAYCFNHNIIQLHDYWKPVQQLLQKYAVLLCKCQHLSSATILEIFKSILNKQNSWANVSDDNILQFIDALKRLGSNVPSIKN